jgi:hypothetical protein
VPSPHGTTGSSHYLALDDVPVATDGDDISICTTEKMEKYEPSIIESLPALMSMM